MGIIARSIAMHRGQKRIEHSQVDCMLNMSLRRAKRAVTSKQFEDTCIKFADLEIADKNENTGRLLVPCACMLTMNACMRQLVLIIAEDCIKYCNK